MSYKWRIDKQFSFSYGHRVWSQQLEHEYCEKGDTETKCRHLHGHEGLVHIFLEDTRLERGMVTDFKHLGWLKDFLDDTIDHKFIIDYHDPLFEQIINGKIRGQSDLSTGEFRTIESLDLPRQNGTPRQLPLVPVYVPGTPVIAGYRTDTTQSCILGKDNVFVVGPEKEFYEGFFIVDFVPTSEHLCGWLFNIVNQKMSKLGIKTSQVDWFETAKSRSSFSVD